MGNLLKVLYSREPAETPDIFVDFENCIATLLELPVWTQVNEVLHNADAILDDLGCYTGASTEIREAISNPGEEFQDKAWEAVLPRVGQLKRYYDFSTALETTVPNLLSALCSAEMQPRQHLEMQQALFKQFAEIIDFTLKFDDLKMKNPAIQNDFSYYRRVISRMRLSYNEGAHESQLKVTNAVAGRMSLFYAHATPMLKVLSDTTSKFVTENKDIPIENTTDCLSTMAGICRVMIENPKYRSKMTNDETIMFCLRVMVGVIILYDHVHPVGAFAKASPIDMRNSIKVLKDQDPSKVDCLLNALRYTTRHLNDDTTPKPIKALLA